MFPFSDSIYKYLKWVAAIVLPAFTTLIGTIGIVMNWTPTDKVVIITAAVNTFLGALVGVSSQAYGKQEAHEDADVSNPTDQQPDLYREMIQPQREKDKEKE